MARYTGARLRILRRLGVDLPGLTGKTAEERPYPPGEHGARRRRRRRPSDYAERLREKQKLRFNYGVTERQLKRYVERAARAHGPTGENLLRTLEQRLDNVVFRLGLAPTIPAARQIVRHKHITVNGKPVSVPGFRVSPGDRIEARPESASHPQIAEGAAHGPSLALPSYLERLDSGLGGRMTSTPDRADVPLEVDERLVIEFYAR